ncbi:hypothetical protein B0H14DRAFT_3064291, partial [Mycena olivaceomarginata]
QPAPVPGAQQNQQQRPGLCGGAPSSSNIFGASAANANGAPKSTLRSAVASGSGSAGSSNSTSSPTTQAADEQTQFAWLIARTEGIAAAWNAGGAGGGQFQYIFYNRVDPAQVGLYGRPPNATNDALWARAVRENPDLGLVPAITVAFDDLRQREKWKTRTVHALSAGAREPPAPARVRAALVGHLRRGGGTVWVAGGATGAGGRNAWEAGRAVGTGRRAGGGTGGRRAEGGVVHVERYNGPPDTSTSLQVPDQKRPSAGDMVRN